MIKTEGYRKEWKAMKGNLILIHGGGPTAVINASLAGAIRQAKKEPNVDRILAAIGGNGRPHARAGARPDRHHRSE